MDLGFISLYFVRSSIMISFGLDVFVGFSLIFSWVFISMTILRMESFFWFLWIIVYVVILSSFLFNKFSPYKKKLKIRQIWPCCSHFSL